MQFDLLNTFNSLHTRRLFFSSHKKITNITLAVPRSYKNVNGEYDTDFISCVLWQGIAENTVNYIKKGDLLGIKGRVQSRVIEEDEEVRKNVMEIVAEKVTFLSSKKADE